MRVGWLSLTGFRSYDNLEWAPEPGVNLLIGPNGAGKTNLLEAVGYLGSLKSFRGAPEAALVSTGADTAVARASVWSEERERLVELEIRRKGGRRVQVDKNPLRRTADLLGVLRVVAFLPEDLDLIKRGPALRRDLLDDIAVQLWPSAYLDQSEFDRSLRQRNAFLKSGDRDPTTLGVWDSRLSQEGGKVLARRARVIESLAPLLDDAHRDIAGSGKRLEITYTTSWDGTELVQLSAADYTALIDKGLESSRRTDYERRMTTVGPHRDEPGFTLEGLDARSHASQGEQRTVALAVRLATHRLLFDTFGEHPILLLDDVFSELDAERAGALAANLPAESQTLITSARGEDLPVMGREWKVGGGSVE